MHLKRFQKQILNCMVEAHESTRPRMESVTEKNHEDHIAGKGQKPMSQYHLVQQLIPMPEVVKIPDARRQQWIKNEKSLRLS